MYPIPFNSGIRSLLLCLLTPVMLLGGALSAPAADLSAAISLQRHLASGRLPASVKQQLDSDGSCTVLVLMADDDVRSEAARLRTALKTTTDTDEILRDSARLLKEKKGRLLAGLSPFDHERLADFEHFSVLYLQLNDTALARLLDDPDVAGVRENRRHRHFLTQSLPLIGQPQVQSRGYTGNGSSVAILDTGVDYTLTAFGSCTAPGVPASCAVIYAQDIAPDDNRLDDDGHGTNVAGIVAGVAPDAGIIALDVFRRDYAYDSDLLTALNWVLANRSTYNIAAVNMSLGGGEYSAPCASDILAGAVASLRSAGVISAISSGNEAYTGAIASPACVPAAVSVGAVYDSNLGSRSWSNCSDSTTAADQVTCFTNMADFLTIVAPGSVITAAGRTYSGTSQASPHVAGAAAVIKSAQPALSGDQLASRLTATGTTVSVTRQTASGPVTYQKPRLNLDAALIPDITTSPAAVDFGVVAVNSAPQAQTVTLGNSGTSDLVLGTLSLSGADATLFSLQADTCTATTLAPGAACTADIQHTASSVGIRSALLAVPSNDPDTPQLSIPLSAEDGAYFTLSVATSGNGTVTSLPAGIDCGATCSTPFFQDTVVTLTPTPGIDSYFTGWSGGCSGTGSCQPAMTAPLSVAAAFSLLPPTRISSTSTVYYPDLTAAYAAAASGDTIQLKATTLAENVLCDREIAVVIKGGYDGSYSVVTGYTVIAGSLTVAAGTVTPENLVIR